MLPFFFFRVRWSRADLVSVFFGIFFFQIQNQLLLHSISLCCFLILSFSVFFFVPIRILSSLISSFLIFNAFPCLIHSFILNMCALLLFFHSLIAHGQYFVSLFCTSRFILLVFVLISHSILCTFSTQSFFFQSPLASFHPRCVLRISPYFFCYSILMCILCVLL